MYNFNVRPATIKDAEAICKYNKTHGRSALSLEKTEASLREIISEGTNKVLVAIHSRHIAALVQAIRQWAEQMLAAKIVLSAKVYDLEKYSAFEEDNYIKDERSLVYFRKL